MKTALVTGASRGIGRETAVLLSKNGYHVYGTYLNSADHAKAIERDYGIKMIKCDVANPDDIAALHRITGPVQLLVNNAGVALFGVFQTVPDSARRRMYEINLFGTVNMTKEYVSDMINAKDGVIINVSSVFGETGGSCEVDYSASKAAIIGFTKALAKEVGPCDIRVNCVCPGIIDTDMNARLTVEEIREFTEIVPLERLGKAHDIAQSVLFLASDAASYINGAILDINGGL